MPTLVAHKPISITGATIFEDGNFLEYIRISKDEILVNPGWSFPGYPGGFTFRLTGVNLDTSWGEISGIEAYYNGMLAFSITDVSLPVADLARVGQLGMPELMKYNDIVTGTSMADVFFAGGGSDHVFGFGGNDYIHGQDQADYLAAGKGDDVVRGGKGHDEVIGGLGSDTLYGGEGANELWLSSGRTDFRFGLQDGGDGDLDLAYVLADSKLNPLGNPNGMNADLIFQADKTDKIFINGVEDRLVSFQAGITDPKGRSHEGRVFEGIGIFADGVLEALVVASGLNVFDVGAMTTGGFFS